LIAAFEIFRGKDQDFGEISTHRMEIQIRFKSKK
jgi:hypothetical protein